MRKSVAWSIIFLFAALALRLFGPVDPSPQIRDTFVLVFAGAGLVCAGFGLCETGPLARAHEAVRFGRDAHLEYEVIYQKRLHALSDSRRVLLQNYNKVMGQLNASMLKAASLEESNKSLRQNGTSLFKRLDKAEHVVEVLRSEIRHIAKSRDIYGATVGVLGRVLDGGRFVGEKTVTDYIASVVRECREKYRNPNFSDEQKRELLSVEIKAGALLRLAPPGKGGAAFTVESVPLVADGPAPARHNLDCIGNEAVPEEQPFRLLDRVVYRDPDNKENPRVYVVVRLNANGTVRLLAENDNSRVIDGAQPSSLCPAGGKAKELDIDFSPAPTAIGVGARVRFKPSERGLAPDDVFTVTSKRDNGTVDLASDGGGREFCIHTDRLVRV